MKQYKKPQILSFDEGKINIVPAIAAAGAAAAGGAAAGFALGLSRGRNDSVAPLSCVDKVVLVTG